MKTTRERPPAFRDGKIRFGSLPDLLMREVGREIEERKAALAIRSSPSSEAALDDVAACCFEILTHPALQHRLRRLEWSVSRLWLDPASFVDWPDPPNRVLEGRSAVFHPQPVGRINGTGRECPESAVGMARFSPDLVSALLPASSSRTVQEFGPGSFPAGTLVHDLEPALSLGYFGTTRFTEAAP